MSTAVQDVISGNPVVEVTPNRSFPVLWLDTETTGTDPKRNGIIQIAGIIERDGNEMECFNFMVRPFPDDEIEDEALRVNRISREKLETFPEPALVHAELTQLFDRFVDKYVPGDRMIFAGFNATFDLNFMHAWFRKCGDPYFGSYVWWPPRDVATLAMERLHPIRHHINSFKLGGLAAFLGIAPCGDLHDALTDVRLTRAIYRHLQLQRGASQRQSA